MIEAELPEDMQQLLKELEKGALNVQTQLVIFDWDGTLFNSVGQIVASLKLLRSNISNL